MIVIAVVSVLLRTLVGWVRLDDDYPDHPKVVAAGNDAELMFVRALCYSKKWRRMGLVPKNAISKIGRGMSARDAGKARDALLREGLFHDVETAPDCPSEICRRAPRPTADEWSCHDFLYFNPASETDEERRLRISAVRSAAGRARVARASRRADGRLATSDDPDAVPESARRSAAPVGVVDEPTRTVETVSVGAAIAEFDDPLDRPDFDAMAERLALEDPVPPPVRAVLNQTEWHCWRRVIRRAPEFAGVKPAQIERLRDEYGEHVLQDAMVSMAETELNGAVKKPAAYLDSTVKRIAEEAAEWRAKKAGQKPAGEESHGS